MTSQAHPTHTLIALCFTFFASDGLVAAPQPDSLFQPPFGCRKNGSAFTKLELAGLKLPDLVAKIEIIAQTLAKLHDENIWHRDLKPENLFVLDNHPVIGDFGLVDFPGKEAISMPEDFLGARNYIAPEMTEDAADKPAGPADVYSLAKTLWVLASGKRYPPNETLRMDVPELRFSNLCPHPRAIYFDRLVESATDYGPSRRPTMREFARELSEWLNPPTTESLKTDLTASTKEYQNVFEVENRAKRNRDELIDAAKAVLLSFEPVLKQIADGIKEHTKIETYVGNVFDLESHQFIVILG